MIVVFALCASIVALVGAYFMEYRLHLAPCKLCHYQRYLYMVLLGLCLLYICHGIVEKISQFWLLYLAGAHFIMLGSIGLSVFHFGLEMHWWQYLSNCAVDFHMDQSFEDFKNQINNADLIQCNIVQTRFFGIFSPAALNLIYSLGVEIVLLYFSTVNKIIVTK